MTKQSHICNSIVLSKKDGETKPLFEEGGDICVNIDGYLICPVDMFTARQLNAARKKYYSADYGGN